MRKRRHRRVNPRNREYDRFYVINYLVSLSPPEVGRARPAGGPCPGTCTAAAAQPQGAQARRRWARSTQLLRLQRSLANAAALGVPCFACCSQSNTVCGTHSDRD